MTYNPEMWRTEELYVFRSSGDLSDYGQVVIGSAGISAKYNPIPSILENIIDRPCSENVSLARFALATYFAKKGLCKDKESVDVANDVIAWFLDPNCHACHGTGLKNIEQETCPVCGGVKKMPTWEPAKRGIAEIKSLFAWREIQLRKSHRVVYESRNYKHASYDGESTHRLNIFDGLNGLTPKRPTADESDDRREV